MHRALTSLAAILLTAGLANTSFAQGIQTGTIRGTVRDQQSLAIPGVTVTISSPALQGQRTNVTGADGAFTFTSLPPGEYQVHYEIQGFTPVTRPITVPLGGIGEQSVTMAAAGVTESVHVVAESPAPLTTPEVGANFKHEEIDSLATPRTLEGIAQLAPGLTENAPNTTQVVINGAFAFDNSFMLNGVDVNDNLFGSPQNLFIEDAIQETQVITSGVSAEYGRFTGGVVNAITKSGGNNFSGSLRLNFLNPSWTDETPFEKSSGVTHVNDLNETWEGTFGGPILRDRLWFFSAGRWANTATSASLPKTNSPNTENDRNRRGEIKATGTVAGTHTIQAGYLNNHTEEDNFANFDFTIDRPSLINRVEPNWYSFANYHGTIGTNLLAEAQYSERRFSFQNAGGTSTNIVESPFITLTQDLAQYNAPYFDASDPEERNNRQFTGSLTYFLDKAGRHQFKGGYEWFRSQRTGGNSQSATNYVFLADYLTDTAGTPLLDDAGHLIPTFVPGASQIQNWLPQRGAILNVDTNSVYAQDHWLVNPHLSVDAGARFEHVNSIAIPAQVQGVKTNTVVPRLAAAYDIKGNGNHVVHVTYGWYSGRYNEVQIGGNNNVGNPDVLIGVYNGPAGEGRGFAPGFDPNNYETIFGSFPTANIFFDPGLHSPIVREFTTSYGLNIANGRGYAEGSYIHRRTVDLIEDFIQLSNGVTDVVKNGVDYGTFTNHVFTNTDIADRVYDGLEFQTRYKLTPRWSINGHLTVQLRNDGNYEGEAANQPGLTSPIGDWPEAFNAARTYPDGHLQAFERARARIWSVYNFGLGRAGDLAVSGLVRIDSGRVYSLIATNQQLTSIQLANIAAYPDSPSSQNVFFGDRGAQFFDGYAVMDTSINYNVPVFKSARPYVKLDIYNLFNNQKVIGFDTTILPDPNSPKDSLGLATGYLRGPAFGQANDNRDFPQPFNGLTGGRTFRAAVGFRF